MPTRTPPERSRHQVVDTPLTTLAFREELRRHRTATWWGMLGLVLLIALVVAVWVTGS